MSHLSVSCISTNIQDRGLQLNLLYIAVVLCGVIGQLHADKCDFHAKII